MAVVKVIFAGDFYVEEEYIHFMYNNAGLGRNGKHQEWKEGYKIILRAA